MNNSDVHTRLGIAARGAELTDAELEAVSGGKDVLTAFGSMASGIGGYASYPRRSSSPTSSGAANRATA